MDYFASNFGRCIFDFNMKPRLSARRGSWPLMQDRRSPSARRQSAPDILQNDEIDYSKFTRGTQTEEKSYLLPYAAPEVTPTKESIPPLPLVVVLDTDDKYAGATLHRELTAAETIAVNDRLEHASAQILYWSSMKEKLKQELAFNAFLQEGSRKRRAPSPLLQPAPLPETEASELPLLLLTKSARIPAPTENAAPEPRTEAPKRGIGKRGKDKKPRKGTKAWKEQEAKQGAA